MRRSPARRQNRPPAPYYRANSNNRTSVAAESAVRLVAIMRQFEMLQKAINIGNELNSEAIEASGASET